jgi:hypothetical protein
MWTNRAGLNTEAFLDVQVYAMPGVAEENTPDAVIKPGLKCGGDETPREGKLVGCL